jgi:hypothetical protein
MIGDQRTETPGRTEEEKREDYLRALLVERQGYVTFGRSDRVADVDRELERLGHREAAVARSAAQPAAPRGRRSASRDTAQG